MSERLSLERLEQIRSLSIKSTPERELLAHVDALQTENEFLNGSRKEHMELHRRSIDLKEKYLSQLSESRVREASLRAALEHIKRPVVIGDCCHKAFHKGPDELGNHHVAIACEALSSSSGNALKKEFGE